MSTIFALSASFIFDNVFRIIYQLIIQFGDVDHAFDLRVIGESDENAEIGNAGDDAINNLPDGI